MFTLKLASYKEKETLKLLDLLENVKCDYFPVSDVVSFYEDGLRYCYKCEYRHFCKDIVTTTNFLLDYLSQQEKTKFTLC